jgi:hypothetical protein
MTRRKRIGSWKHTAIAVAAAYALVLQALLLSFGGAVHVSAAPQGIVCAQNGGASAPDQAPGRAHDGLCCILGCHGPGAGGETPAAASPGRPQAFLAAASSFGAEPFLRLSSNVLPLGSRAPPRLG